MSQEAAFAPVRNPANPDRVFIYRVAPGVHTLSYDQRALHKGVAAPRWNKNPSDTDQDDAETPGAPGVPSTLIRGDSNIVSLVFDDVVHVYGVVAGTNYVSLLSPFVEPVRPKIECNLGKLAGCAFTEHDEEQARLIYQGYDSNKENKIPKLFFSDVTSPDAQDMPSTAKDVKNATSLSLFHDSMRFWIIYQNKDGQLVAHNEKDQKPSVISPDTSHFLDNTPIGSCFIPAKDIDSSKVPGFRPDALGRVIVYWVREFNHTPCLYRSHADLTEKSSSADFSEPRQATENGVSVQKFSQIGIVPNPQTQSNYVFISKEGADNISSVTDDWATKNESLYGLDMTGMELFKRWQAKMVEEAIFGQGRLRYGDDFQHHHHNGYTNGHNGYTNGFTNGPRLVEEEFVGKLGSKIVEEEMLGRLGNGNKNLPLVWRNKGDSTKPQLHSGVITKTASSQWSEAEVQVVIPAGSTILGDIMVKLKVRPTD